MKLTSIDSDHLLKELKPDSNDGSSPDPVGEAIVPAVGLGLERVGLESGMSKLSGEPGVLD